MAGYTVGGVSNELNLVWLKSNVGILHTKRSETMNLPLKIEPVEINGHKLSTSIRTLASCLMEDGLEIIGMTVYSKDWLSKSLTDIVSTGNSLLLLESPGSTLFNE